MTLEPTLYPTQAIYPWDVYIFYVPRSEIIGACPCSTLDLLTDH